LKQQCQTSLAAYGAIMKNLDQPRKAMPPPGKPPRTVRQQLEYDAWTNHYPFARRMAGRRRQSGPSLTERGLTEPGLIERRLSKNARSLSRQDRTLLAVSLMLLLLLLFARASAAQEQPDARHQSALQDICLDGEMPGKGSEELASLLPTGSSVNLAGFSSTSTGWKAQLVYSLATLFFAASLLWFSTPSRRLQAGCSPPPF
jgi:hypothetical protein